NIRRTKTLTWIAVLGRATRGANVRIEDVQMAGSILVVLRTASKDVVQFIERQRVVETRPLEAGHVAPEVIHQLLHALVTRCAGQTIRHAEATAAREQAKSHVEHAGKPAALEALMEISRGIEFPADPRLFNALLVGRQPFGRGIAG